MKVVLAVATASAALRTWIAANRDRVVPPEVTSRGYLRDRSARFSTVMLALDEKTGGDDVAKWLRELVAGAHGVILLIDDNMRPKVSHLEDAYFVASITNYPGKVFQNQVHSLLAPIIRHFIAYSQRFDSLRNQRMLLLPLDIFRADHLAELRLRVTTGKMDAGLGEALDRLLAALNERARPKSRQRNKTVYLVDDRPLFYRYGPERHAVVETVNPPHGEGCWHRSQFRFGRLYDDRLHHNVDDDSDPTHVYGEFRMCHGAILTAKGESHLNIFPNGYI